MKNLKILLLTTAVVVSFTANAHEASLHKKKAPAKADCSGYNKMVASGKKMDMTDPVMIAMMKKCKNQKAESEHDNADGHHDSDENKVEKAEHEQSSEHKGKGEMKCGGEMKAATKKIETKIEKKVEKEVEKKVEEHDTHDH